LYLFRKDGVKKIDENALLKIEKWVTMWKIA
jgi:hypothetical protein